MTAGNRASLQTRVLRHVLLSLGLTWMLGAAVVLAIGHFFTQRAFDRAVLDDAYLLASGVQLRGGQLHLALTPGEVRNVLFDQAEVILYSVRAEDDRLVSGSAALPEPAGPAGPGYEFDDVTIEGRGFRRVTLRVERPLPFKVMLAQSDSARNQLLRDLVVFSLLPQLVLLGLLLWWLRRVVAAEVAPLERLQHELQGRAASDLSLVRIATAPAEVDDVVRAINALFQRLEESLQAQREFTGNVAHELRTPLAGIRALADYGMRHREPAVWLEQLESIVAAETRATRALDKLLHLALANEAKAALKLVPLRLDRVVHDAVLRFLAAADRQGVDLGAEGVEQPVEVLGDLALVEGILNNLLENALLHGASRAAERPQVTVSVEERGATVVLAVEDNGPGMEPDEAERVLQRGIRGATGGGPGRVGGLGLALVTQYAQLLGVGVSFARGPSGAGWRCALVFPAVPLRAAPIAA